MPAAQAVQVAAAGEATTVEYVPAAHAEQAPGDVAPGRLEYEPGGQRPQGADEMTRTRLLLVSAT